MKFVKVGITIFEYLMSTLSYCGWTGSIFRPPVGLRSFIGLASFIGHVRPTVDFVARAPATILAESCSDRRDPIYLLL